MKGINIAKMKMQRDGLVDSNRAKHRAAAKRIGMPDDLEQMFWDTAFAAGKSDGVYESTDAFVKGMSMAKAQATVAIAAGKKAEEHGPN